MVYDAYTSNRGASAVLIAAVIVLGMLMFAGCAPDAAEQPVAPPSAVDEAPAPPEQPAEESEPSAFPWLDVELEDVQTGERFRIADFRGRPVLIKSFAVW